MCAQAVACAYSNHVHVTTIDSLIPYRSSSPISSDLVTMSFTPTSRSNFDSTFNAALDAYKRQTKNDLASHPLLSRLQFCDSPEDILTILREQIPSFADSQSPYQSQSGDDGLSKWLVPTVNVLYAFSATLSEGVGVVSIISRSYSELGALHSDVNTSADVLTSEIHFRGHGRSAVGQYGRIVCTGQWHCDAQILSRQLMIPVLVGPSSSNSLATSNTSLIGLRPTQRSHRRGL